MYVELAFVHVAMSQIDPTISLRVGRASKGATAAQARVGVTRGAIAISHGLLLPAAEVVTTQVHQSNCQ